MNEFTGALSPSPSPPPTSRTLPFREDCWSEEATDTLVDAWGDRYLELNRGNLRQKHWQEVANAINERHGHVNKSRRTDIQCKNRIDTLKKRYKVEKTKVSDSGGSYVTSWPFFDRLDVLIGSSFQSKKKSSLSPVVKYRKPLLMLPPMSQIPVAPRSAIVKRASSQVAGIATDDSYFRRNFSVFAAAAAEEDNSDCSRSKTSVARSRRREDNGAGYMDLAHAVTRFGEIYERVEGAKRRQMVELEKQRMQFAKDLEVQRMKLFVDTQVQLEKIKRAKRSSGVDSYS